MKAVTAGDYARSRLPAFKQRVDATLSRLESVISEHKTGVAFSGGKDSVVALDLARRVAPNITVAFFDSGCEYNSTYQIVNHYNVQIIYPEQGLIELCKYGGYWGYANPIDPDADVDFYAFLVDEPSQRWSIQNGLEVIALGLRSHESKGRELNIKKRGQFYEVMNHPCKFRFLPLAHWLHNDIWAYIASRELEYNTAYDKMAAIGIPRERWRVSALLGLCGASTMGRYSYLRQIEPAKFNELLRDFPKLAEYV